MSAKLGKFNLRKNVIFSIVAFVINVGLVFISYRLVIEQGGLEAIGLWSTLYAWTTFIRLGDFGMSSASLRFVAICDSENDTRQIKAYIETGLIFNLLLFGILGGIGYWLFSTNISNIIEDDFVQLAADVLPVMVVSFILMNISGTLSGSLQGLHVGYVNSQMTVFGNVIQIMVVIILVPRLGILGLAWAQLVQHLVTACFAWVLVRKYAKIDSILPVGFSLESCKEMLGFSLKAQLVSTINGIFEPISKLMVGHFGGLQTLGIFELAFKTVSLSRNFVVSGLSAALPTFTTLVSEDNDKALELYRRSVKIVSILSASIFLIVSLLSPLISIIWFGSLNWNYVLFVLLICVGFMGNVYGAAAYQLGAATGVMKNNIISTLLSLAVLVSVGAALSRDFQANGVVFATMLGLSVGGVFVKMTNEKLLLNAGSDSSTV